MSHHWLKLLQILSYDHHILFLKLFLVFILKTLSLKLVDFAIAGFTTEHRYKRAIFKLCFKKRLKEHPSLLKYF